MVVRSKSARKSRDTGKQRISNETGNGFGDDSASNASRNAIHMGNWRLCIWGLQGLSDMAGNPIQMLCYEHILEVIRMVWTQTSANIGAAKHTDTRRVCKSQQRMCPVQKSGQNLTSQTQRQESKNALPGRWADLKEPAKVVADSHRQAQDSTNQPRCQRALSAPLRAAAAVFDTPSALRCVNACRREPATTWDVSAARCPA